MSKVTIPFEEMLVDPVAALGRARRESWLADTGLATGVLRWEDVRALLADPRLHEGFVRFMTTLGVTSGPFFEWMSRSPLNLDGETHLRWRAVLSRTFTPRRVEGIRPFLRDTAHALVDGFAARDGYFVVQAVRDHQLAQFARAIGHEDWLSDPRFATREGWRDQMDSVVRPAVESWAADKTKLEASTVLAEQGIAAGPCFTPEDLVVDPHVASHDMLLRVPRPDGGEPMLVVGNPIKLSGTPERPPRRWPTLGEHTDAVLRDELGLRDDDLRALRGKGVIGGG